MFITGSLVLLLVLHGVPGPVAKVPVGRETTFVTGPLDKDGFIDYEAALNARLRKGINLETNANVLLWQALGPTPEGGPGMPAEFFKWMGIKEPPQEGTYFMGLQAYMKDHLKLNPVQFKGIQDHRDWTAQRPWKAIDHPQIAGWLKANEKPLVLVIEATRRPHYFSPIVAPRTEDGSGLLLGALLPCIQKCRELAAALACRAMLRVGEGQFDEAWGDLLACHRLARLVGCGATLMEGLVGVAIEMIATKADLGYLERSHLTSVQVQDRLKDLQRLSPLPATAEKIDLGERIIFLDLLQCVRRRGPDILDAHPLDSGKVRQADPVTLEAMDLIDWEPTFRTANHWYNRLVAVLRLPDRPSREKELNKFYADLKALKNEAVEPKTFGKLLQGKEPASKAVGKRMGETFICLLMPNTRLVHNAQERGEQTQRNLRIAFALAAFQSDHGRYPARLDELAPRHLAEVPNDLF